MDAHYTRRPRGNERVSRVIVNAVKGNMKSEGVNDETIFYCKHPVLSIRRIHNRTNMVGFICISHRVPSMLGYGLRMGDGVI